MDDLFITIKKYSESNDFYSVLNLLYKKEQQEEIVIYAGTYPLDMALEKYGYYDIATYYIYTKKDKKGYNIYLNRMGCGISEDDKIFKFSHRYLYNKNHLSNCFFNEEDYRCGEFFKKKKRK